MGEEGTGAGCRPDMANEERALDDGLSQRAAGQPCRGGKTVAGESGPRIWDGYRLPNVGHERVVLFNRQQVKLGQVIVVARWMGAVENGSTIESIKKANYLK